MNSNVKEGHGFDLWWGSDRCFFTGRHRFSVSSLSIFLLTVTGSACKKNVLFKVAQVLHVMSEPPEYTGSVIM